MKLSGLKISIAAIALIILLPAINRGKSEGTHYEDIDGDYELQVYFLPFLLEKREPEIRAQVKIGSQFFIRYEKPVGKPEELPNGDRITYILFIASGMVEMPQKGTFHFEGNLLVWSSRASNTTYRVSAQIELNKPYSMG